MAQSAKPIRVFCSYARADKEYANHLAELLAPLRSQGLNLEWRAPEIRPGQTIQTEFLRHHDEANIVLMLVSPDFIGSNAGWNIEMARALANHERDGTIVVPIIVRECDWHSTPIGQLQVLPTGGNAVHSAHWHSAAEAWSDVASGIRHLMQSLGATKAGNVVEGAGFSRGSSNAFATGRVDHIVDLQWPDVMDRMSDFATLGPDWDSYGAAPISSVARKTARDLLVTLVNVALADHPALSVEELKPYFVAPIPFGGVQLEWRHDQIEIEVEARPDGSLGYLVIDRRSATSGYHEQPNVTMREVVDRVIAVMAGEYLAEAARVG